MKINISVSYLKETKQLKNRETNYSRIPFGSLIIFTFSIVSHWFWIVGRIDYEYDKVFKRYVQNRLCNSIVFERILKVDYERVFRG